MHNSITVDELFSGLGGVTLVDVRKPMARLESGITMPEAQWRHPFDAASWVGDTPREGVVVFCVHGHEVSQGVAGFLRDEGIQAVYLEGGFEAWREAGGAVQAKGSDNE